MDFIPINAGIVRMDFMPMILFRAHAVPELQSVTILENREIEQTEYTPFINNSVRVGNLVIVIVLKMVTMVSLPIKGKPIGPICDYKPVTFRDHFPEQIPQSFQEYTEW